MAKTKAKKTMEEKKLDALLAIGKRLAGIEKLMKEQAERAVGDQDVEWGE